MTPTELRACLEHLNWSQRGLARVLGRNEGTVRQWARGALDIPADVALWLQECASFMASHPPPVWSRT